MLRYSEASGLGREGRRSFVSTLRMTVAAVVLVCCRVTAAEPATTQTAGDVVVTVRTIDTKPTLISGKFTDVPAAKLFDQIADRAGAQIFIKQEALDDPQ